ncbi:hypothetical protein [Sporosarcina obsidiansis]|uniref:hypothetical protein n=1 Tax=Sporosarcina obsidiansis TaxID=2660748 RepID=UPI00129AE3B7|nr:hypothetical protein [Sporosarcina obsidiansis]
MTRTIQTGGSYTPADSKTATGSRTYEDTGKKDVGDSSVVSLGGSFPGSISYNSGGYSGTLYPTSGSSCGSWVHSSGIYYYRNCTKNYSGTVTKPASDTRTYAYYYQYNVTFNYETNVAPTISVNTPNNATLYENDTFLVDGSAKDTDAGNVVIVRYQINNGTAVAIETKVSDGTTSIPFSRQFTFKGGKLHYNGSAITEALDEGTAHTLKVWAEDDQGGKSEVIERTFYVVPNRPPKLTINPFETLSDLINADKVTFTGSTSDPDGNDIIVSYKLNGGLATEVYRGKDGDWSFDLLLSALKDGENTIVVETVDSYNFKTSLTRKLNKQANLTPLANSVQRYTIVPPAGSAQGVLMWLERDESQYVKAEISMTNGTEPENFVPMIWNDEDIKDDPQPGPISPGVVEDFLKFRADSPAEKIAIKLSWTGDKPIFKVSGALLQ